MVTDKSDWILVPRKPNRVMLEAICKRRGLDPHANIRDALDELTVSVMTGVVADYEIMVDAAQDT